MERSSERHQSTVDESDVGLLTRVGRGSPEAFEALFDRYGALAFTIAMRVLSDEGAAQDVAQEAFLAVWRNAAAYIEERGSVRTWICAIVRNRAIDRLRGDASRRRYELAVDNKADGPTVPDVWAEVASALSREQVRAALDMLPWEQRQTIELAYWCGMTQREIGEALRVPLGTVKGRARLALAKLRDTLQTRESTWQG